MKFKQYLNEKTFAIITNIGFIADFFDDKRPVEVTDMLKFIRRFDKETEAKKWAKDNIDIRTNKRIKTYRIIDLDKYIDDNIYMI